MDLEISDTVLFMLKRDRNRFIERRAITKLLLMAPQRARQKSERNRKTNRPSWRVDET